MAWGRGRGSARPGWLPGGEGERKRASGGEQAREAETRQGARLGAVPGVFESPMAAAARRRRAELQDLGNQHAHCLFPLLSPFVLLFPLPSFPPSPRFTLPGLVASSSEMP